MDFLSSRRLRMVAEIAIFVATLSKASVLVHFSWAKFFSTVSESILNSKHFFILNNDSIMAQFAFELNCNRKRLFTRRNRIKPLSSYSSQLKR
ncbi:hypothetical protein CPB83DRAFT_865178 [Crepidotus variabilis]|uniref:Uncharacterized protein n=1 Tax=Crepidotus variabilis TaxID=179855 RepID=A0A9P6JI03_9AGAR|nr:hypothetical protein CPB83DRAFT_865178 [Crepidotus variabilis]